MTTGTTFHETSITDVTLELVDKGRVKAAGSITLDGQRVMRGILVVDTRDHGLDAVTSLGGSTSPGFRALAPTILETYRSMISGSPMPTFPRTVILEIPFRRPIMPPGPA